MNLGDLYREYLLKEFGGSSAAVGLGGSGDTGTVSAPTRPRAAFFGRIGASTLMLMGAVACVAGVLVGTGLIPGIGTSTGPGHSLRCLIFVDCPSTGLGSGPAATAGSANPPVAQTAVGLGAVAQAPPSPLTPSAPALAAPGPGSGAGAGPGSGGSPTTLPAPVAAVGSVLSGAVVGLGNTVTGITTAATVTLDGVTPVLAPVLDALNATLGSSVAGVSAVVAIVAPPSVP